MTENLYTGEFYKITKTGQIGEKIECPCDDPIILEFKGGGRDAYHLRDVERAERPTHHQRVKKKAKREKLTRTGLRPSTIKNFLKIYNFIRRNEPVTHEQIKALLGFNCWHYLGSLHSGNSFGFTLKSLGIIEKVPLRRTWCAWRLTEQGRNEGETIIKGLSEKQAKEMWYMRELTRK